MDDLISRAAAKFQACNWSVNPNAVIYDGIKEAIKSQLDMAPAVDAVPVVHGHWIEDRTDIVCGVCGARYKDEIVFMPDVVYVNGKRYDGLKYCPNCGAKMDEEG